MYRYLNEVIKVKCLDFKNKTRGHLISHAIILKILYEQNYLKYRMIIKFNKFGWRGY